MNTTEKALYSLMRAALLGKGADADEIRAALADGGIGKLYSLAKEHDLAHLVGCELDKLSLLSDDEISKKLRKAHYAAVFRYRGMEHAIGEIKNAFCKANIPHMPLKGSVLRYRYPEAWMRTSCDIDVLVKREDVERAGEVLVGELGYTLDHSSEHDVTYTSTGGVTVELHFTLIEASENERIVNILRDPWSSATPDENGYTYIMNDALFYFYHVAHMLKHFLYGGCGIRSFVDLWVLDNMKDADALARDKLLLDADILTFAEKSRALALCFLGEREVDDEMERFAGYVISGGIYGGVETRVYIQQARRGGKLGYAMRRIFPPYKTLCIIFPIAKKHKILVPILHVVRWFKIIFGGKARSSVKELRANNSLDENKAKEAEEMLLGLGIDKKRYTAAAQSE